MLKSLFFSNSHADFPAGSASGDERFVVRFLPYLVIILLTVLYNFPSVVPGMGNIRDGDFAMFYLPFRIYSSLQLHAGDLPFRSNALFGGYPIWQDPQFSLLYPVNLLFGLLAPNFANETVIDFYLLVNMLILSVSSVFFYKVGWHFTNWCGCRRLRHLFYSVHRHPQPIPGDVANRVHEYDCRRIPDSIFSWACLEF